MFKGEDKKIRKKGHKLMLVLVLSIVVMLISFLFTNAVFDTTFLKSYLSSFKLIVLNLVPIFIIMLTVTILTNKIWIGNLFTGLLFFGMGVGNKYKLIYRDEPINFLDIKLLSEAGDMAGKYDVSITPPMILVLIFILLTSYLLRRYVEDWNFKIKDKLIRTVLITLVSGLLLNHIYFDQKLYAEVGDKEIINIWSETQQAQSKGLIYPFLYSISSSKDRVLEDYDEDRAIEILESYESKDIAEDKRVNFISIMLEAYNDFSVFDGVELEKDIYENFHKIQEDSYSGNLITNVFAGGTINTEWGYLNGINSHPSKYIRNTNSYAWYFKDQGYYTESMHPIYGWFYNRRNVNDYLGYDNFDFYENKYKDIQEEFLDDIDFFDYILEGYEENKDRGMPYFHFSTTYQNHGPYSDEKLTDENFLKKKPDYDERLYNIVNNYFSGLNETDKALGELVDYLEAEEEPIVLVFFGDHNPWLGEENRGYEMLDIDINFESEEGFINYYNTPYVFWANSAAKETLGKDFKGEGNDVSPNFLMAELFDYIGYEGDAYMQYSLDLRDSFTVNHDMFFKEGENYTRELSPENHKKWREFNSVEYYYVRNFIYEHLE